MKFTPSQRQRLLAEIGKVRSPRQRVSALVFAMAQLGADTPANVTFEETRYDESYDFAVDANAIIYIPSAVGKNGATGYARQLVAGDDFLGFARSRADNSGNGSPFSGYVPGTGAAGSILVPCRTKGRAVLNVSTNGTMTGVLGDKNKKVYASDGNTFTDSAGGNSQIGAVVEFLGNVSGVQGAGGISQYLVAFQSLAERNA